MKYLATRVLGPDKYICGACEDLTYTKDNAETRKRTRLQVGKSICVLYETR